MNLIIFCRLCRKTPIVTKVSIGKMLLHVLNIRRLDTYRCAYCLGDREGYGEEYQLHEPETRLVTVLKEIKGDRKQ